MNKTMTLEEKLDYIKKNKIEERVKPHGDMAETLKKYPQLKIFKKGADEINKLVGFELIKNYEKVYGADINIILHFLEKERNNANNLF